MSDEGGIFGTQPTSTIGQTVKMGYVQYHPVIQWQ
jgi:hypothetical protein